MDEKRVVVVMTEDEWTKAMEKGAHCISAVALGPDEHVVIRAIWKSVIIRERD